MGGDPGAQFRGDLSGVAGRTFETAWSAGPPKSDLEQWNYARRNELTEMSMRLLTVMLAHRSDIEHGSLDDAALAAKAVSLAQHAQKSLDQAQPRF